MSISQENKSADDVCPDCGAVVVAGAAGCLKLFEEILAREFSDYRYGKLHRLTVDSYSLQHPDAYMRSGKSFAAHLTGMYAGIESEDPLGLNQVVQKWLSANPKIEKPVHIPEERGLVTITYVYDAVDAEDHIKRVREWAEDVWRAWSAHHDLAKHFIEVATSETKKA
ncbi:MAG TPA: DUF5946 family protein [Pyrinomonadaceae bacterium]|nr:DUF5946 family protein [Pyrinomonadaceae bacterium]